MESDYDAETVEELTKKLVTHFGVRTVVKKAVGRRAYSQVSSSGQLEKAISIYLKESDYVIFVLDTDSEVALQERRRHRNSFITQVENIISSNKFPERVYLARIIQELEAWLLIDCLGICCYFARTHYRQESRNKIPQNDKLRKLINKYQKEDTASIEEPTRGGKGAKEHIVKFSEEILKVLSAGKTKAKAIDQNRYDESTAPEVAKYVEVNHETIRRNVSLQHFGQLLVRCSS